ncbi:cytochrome c-type biogenesis protein [Nereida sp. MMG025]|uniref:cytochrome c-type biogenesis protein n=1 Tax=Nereida sp. MMG025 TaxID=2909981 RepID=UPI001F1F8219|nr:cytochrome c-type biogenesis protein [Nereida sp. MMG025]MCF6443603.1 cytochrome c-type biogenesis protein CcmH [Nereida sp. MMG025]
MKRLLLILCLLATPVFAVQPDEVLSDPVLEDRARELSKGLRCPVCRNESIDESSAEVARDLRLVLRERLVAGDTDAQAIAFLVERYGEYVLLNPPVKGSTWLLWLAGPIMLLLAGGVAATYLRGRSDEGRAEAATLSDEELARLNDLIGENSDKT